MRDSFLPFSKPSISEAAINEVTDSMRSGWLTTGPKLKKFEQMLAEYLHVPHALCMSSATAGLQLALMALDIQKGDEVITTPMTFAASLNVIEMVGATVKLVDVERDTYNIDVTKLEAAITKNTKAIMPVHFAGLPVDLDPIYALAKKYNLAVLEDAAHAIGAEYKGKKIGSFGDLQVFSFHPNKNMTTGEGGCLSTHSDKIAEQISLLRFHGMDREAWNRFGKDGSPHYKIIYPGFKYNMMDIQAAIGIHQLPFLDEFIEKRTALAKRYLEKLKDFEYLTLPKSPDYQHKHAWHLFAPTLNDKLAKISRDELMAKLKSMNIGCSVHYEATHLYPYYANKYGFKLGDFPNAEAIGKNVISLPLFPDMTISEQDDVLDALEQIFNTSITN
ncbi:DegT/DnrJ/EryC1/StrS family aminotransferase [Fangia hongkongensis]|uniref:DegT/DnrJ/EryC1/StrS family aminotransferase n=1 Tax=Fangia hongkongensis TaxID=270495 RepID=UPI0003702E15|nr:DegT/DnrJ/EryC1/StrS aminotransferase family protein [Fangia hongkongensis]MBK2126041.1 DegT/DnrJ/EryC1/StrS aminotransferase family protein [Fangia hongkongensis]